MNPPKRITVTLGLDVDTDEWPITDPDMFAQELSDHLMDTAGGDFRCWPIAVVEGDPA